MPLLGSMNDYSPWHCSLMEPGSAVAGHRGRNPLWPGGQSTTGQRTHHSSTCSYHFGSTELACFLEIAQPPRVSTQEWGNTQTPFSLWLFAIQRSADALKMCFMSFFKEEKNQALTEFQLKNVCKAQIRVQDMVHTFKLFRPWEPNFAVFCILQVSCWWFGVGGSLDCGECRVIHLS